MISIGRSVLKFMLRSLLVSEGISNVDINWRNVNTLIILKLGVNI